MSELEHDRLRQLAKDYDDMIDVLCDITRLHTEWQNTLLVTPNSCHRLLIEPSPDYPFKWSETERQQIQTQVLRWKAQQTNIQQVTRLFEESIEAVSVPESAFDDSGSEV